MLSNHRPSTVLLVAAGLLAEGCAQISDLFTNPDGLAIEKFSASPRQVSPGATATLSWNVEGAESIQIDNGIGIVKSKGSAEIKVDRTTTYTITARGGSATATSSVQVMVGSTGASPTPTPTPTASPTPSPTPTPSPSPTPTPSPSTASCKLPAMPECGAAEGPTGVWGCCRAEQNGVFAEEVDEAITKLQAEQPGLFNGDRPRDAGDYTRGVAQILQRDYGFCSKPGGPEDEIGVKNSNGFNEQYDILLSNGRIRWGGFVVTCRPARF